MCAGACAFGSIIVGNGRERGWESRHLAVRGCTAGSRVQGFKVSGSFDSASLQPAHLVAFWRGLVRIRGGIVVAGDVAKVWRALVAVGVREGKTDDGRRKQVLLTRESTKDANIAL